MTLEEKLQEFDKQFAGWILQDDKENYQSFEVVKSFIKSVHSSAVEETEKAFGGCKNCYGKGYSTVKQQATSHTDFGDEKTGTWELNPIYPCTHCQRGEDIKVILSSLQTNKGEEIEKD